MLIAQFTHHEVITAEAVGITAAVMAELEKAVEAKHESVVVKTQTSRAGRPAERRLAWMKRKSNHLAALADSLDFVVVGGYDCATFDRVNMHTFFFAGEPTARESRR